MIEWDERVRDQDGLYWMVYFTEGHQVTCTGISLVVRETAENAQRTRPYLSYREVEFSSRLDTAARTQLIDMALARRAERISQDLTQGAEA